MTAEPGAPRDAHLAPGERGSHQRHGVRPPVQLARGAGLGSEQAGEGPAQGHGGVMLPRAARDPLSLALRAAPRAPPFARHGPAPPAPAPPGQRQRARTEVCPAPPPARGPAPLPSRSPGVFPLRPPRPAAAVGRAAGPPPGRRPFTASLPTPRRPRAAAVAPVQPGAQAAAQRTSGTSAVLPVWPH